MSTEPPDWPSLIAAKRADLASKIPEAWCLSPELLAKLETDSRCSVLDIPRTCGILSEKEVRITEIEDATALVGKMASGAWSAYEVTLAFCKRAAIAHQLTNCLTEIFFEHALTRAKALDASFALTHTPTGPLHGLPLSLKDSFNLPSIPSTLGLVSFLTHAPPKTPSSLLPVLESAGALFYVKTNIPQTMMTADSHSTVFGRTVNPHNRTLTAGGSTGGEAALLALRGSIMGVGTDIAGSVRIPAHCCGLFGFKPTAARVPWKGGTPPGRHGSPSPILPTIGPETHSVRDAGLFLSVACADPWAADEGALNAPWRQVADIQRPLRLGVLTEDPRRPLHPSVYRAIKTAEQRLQSAGHVLVPLDGLVPDVYDAAVLAWKFFLLDPAKTAVRYVREGGEEWVPSIATAMFPELKGWEASLEELFEMGVQRRQVLAAWHDVVVSKGLDAVIMPTYQATAVPHDTYGLPIYTVLANLLDYPAAVVPFLRADGEKDGPFVRDVKYEPPYKPEAVDGAPCGIQIVGRPMRDEELLKAMGVVSQVLECKTLG
ncbi:amidase [Trichodelitschia bisporula]|uniref:Amidase n=1 Tax=Trichodelitschia bisporula TaxID=703511 RepID=A0A6G1HR69_9PEZI|nr:amidase [Trichodelitschia bisporula]